MLQTGRHDLVANGARLAYHVHGDGPLVVVLPGGPGYGHTYLRTPELERAARVVYLDPVGCGDSDELADPSQYGRARDVADLEALRDHLGLEQLALLGHSAGGFLAQEYALAHPARVSRMLLVGTTPTNGPEYEASLDAEFGARENEPWYRDAVAAMDELFARDVTKAEAHELGKKIWPLYTYDADPVLTARVSEVARLNPARAKKAPPAPFDFRERLASLRIPVLVIVGARDFIGAPVLAQMLYRAIPGSRLVTMERSGHLPHLEESEAFAALVGRFLRGE